MRTLEFKSDETGTAALETVLLMPILAFLLVVAFNLAPAPIKKIQAHSSARFAGNTRARISTVADLAGQSASLAQQAAQAAYPGVQVSLGSTTTVWSSPVGALGNRTRATSRTSAPTTVGNLFSFGPSTSTFVIEGVTWTYDDIPISLGEFPKAMAAIATAFSSAIGLGATVSAVVGGSLRAILEFFWLLGRAGLWMLGS